MAWFDSKEEDALCRMGFSRVRGVAAEQELAAPPRLSGVTS